jgi:GMP synthase (glutamine-hydrolysing)
MLSAHMSGTVDGPPTTILVLRAGDAVPEVAARHGEFSAWIRRALGRVWPGDWLEHDLRSPVPLPDPGGFAAIVITGSAASVTERAGWMLRAEEYVRAVARVGTPLFGICFGHQLTAQALGGDVRPNPRGREIGTVELQALADDPLFDGRPPAFHVNASHVDTAAVLPEGARVLAATALEPHAVVAFTERVRGVQFHPEIDGPVMRGYVEARRVRLVEEGIDPEPLVAGAGDTPHGEELLRNFVRHFVLSTLRRAA